MTFKRKNNKNSILLLVLLLVAAVVLFAVCLVEEALNKATVEMSVADAQEYIDGVLDSVPNSVASGAKMIRENLNVTVNDVSYGTEKDIILDCTYSTHDVYSVITSKIDKYFYDAYDFTEQNRIAGKQTNATKIKLLLADELRDDVAASDVVNGEIKIYIYELSDGNLSVYLSDELINTLFGGLVDINRMIGEKVEIEHDGEIISIQNKNTLRTGIKDCLALINYDNSKPDTSIPLKRLWNTFVYDFNRNFIYKNQWKYITDGLLTTLEITFLSVLIGIVIGFIVAIIRCFNQRTGKLDILAGICRIYLSIARGTPVMVQLLIIYFVILLPLGVEKFASAVICFGLNSGAYVSEIVRGGIMSIDEGQTEAGRSLGFNYMQTMYYIIIPQAFKAVLPSLANEFIALLKESSVAFYIGISDLTNGGLKIRSITYSNYMPLLAVAIVYLVLVLGLSKCVSLLERRLHKGDHR